MPLAGACGAACAERVAAGGAVAAVQSLAAEPLSIWASHAVLIQACNQVRIFTSSKNGVECIWALHAHTLARTRYKFC